MKSLCAKVSGCLAIGLWCGASSAQGWRQQREEIRERLSAEKALLTALREEKLGVLEVLDFFQRRAHHLAQAARGLKGQQGLLRDRILRIELQEEEARTEVHDRLSRLAPRLGAWYRVARHPALEVALSASSFDSLIWRLTALSSIVRRDLELLGRAKRVATFQHLALGELNALKDVLASWVQASEREESIADGERRVFRQVLAHLEAEARRSESFVRELNRADEELSRLIGHLPHGVPVSAFSLLKGRLPYPASGLIEVGFGKVINPKFNTLTIQKGVDIRAPLGSAVRAVASGKVVYADWLRGYGNLLIVDHGAGYHTLMAHLDSFAVRAGAEIRRGDELGRVGETGSLKGPFLYFEIRYHGQPLDPAAWLSETER